MHIIMKRVFTCNYYVVLFIAAVLSFPTIAHSQHRIPNVGENIKFYPIVKEQRTIHTGYDCFYVEDLACKNGQYKFKKNYRFMKGKDQLTPLQEIEKHSFHVRDVKTVLIMNKMVMLIYLTRNEDGERIVLRLQLESSRGNNFLSNAMFEYKKVYNGWSFVNEIDRINLAFINSDSLNVYKERYAQKNLVFYENLNRSLDFSQRTSIEKDFNNLIEIINKKRHSFVDGVSYYCMGIGFAKVFEETLNLVPCMKLRTSTGEFIDMPLSYFNKKLSQQIYLPSGFFMTEDKYKEMEIARYGLQPLIDRYEGKDVYYGLDNEYQYDNPYSQKFSAFENRILETNELYTLKKGETYRCDRFCILKRFDKNYKIPFAILKDKSGIEFKVPVNKVDFSNYAATVYCKEFEEYFVLSELVDSIVQKREEIRRLEELAAKERKKSLEKKYGKTYANFLYDQKDSVVKRFDELAKKYGKANAKLIIEGRVRLGWTKEMCRESWGSPHDINTITGSWGVHEQWVYEYSFSDSYSMYCLYFENGILTTIQD